MSVKIKIPSYMKSFTNDMEVVELAGSTVGECLNYLIEQLPDMKKQLFSEDNNLFENIIISVNGESAYPEQLVKPVKDRAEIDIIFIIGGG